MSTGSRAAAKQRTCMKRVQRITFKMVKAEVSAANGLVGATAYFANCRSDKNLFLFCGVGGVFLGDAAGMRAASSPLER